MHHTQAYSARPNRKPTAEPHPDSTNEDPQGVQALSTGLSRVAVSSASNNGTPPQTRYQDRSRGGMDGDRQEWRTTGWGTRERGPRDAGSWRPRYSGESNHGNVQSGRNSPFRTPDPWNHPEQLENAGSRTHQQQGPPPRRSARLANRSPRRYDPDDFTPSGPGSWQNDPRPSYENMHESARYQVHDSHQRIDGPFAESNGFNDPHSRYRSPQRGRRSVTPSRQQPAREPVKTRSRLLVDPSITFEPITQTTPPPPHLQHPFRLYPPGTTFDHSKALHSEPVTERHPPPEYFALAQSSPNVYYTTHTATDPRASRKLVVLDLNGAMLVRSGRSNDPILNIQRKVYPRPFLSAFLDYMLLPARKIDDWSDPTDAHKQQMRPYDAFVWSSAQPLNVDTMIRLAFGKWGMPTSPRAGDRVVCEEMLAKFERVESRPGRVLGVWTRMEMDLTKAQYGKKSLTYKDLEKVVKHFEHLEPTGAETSRFYRPDPDFNPSLQSTLLVDDSTIKACMQPFNHIPIPEYTLESLEATNRVREAEKEDRHPRRGSHDSGREVDRDIETRAGILRQIFGADPSNLLHSLEVDSASQLHDGNDEPKLDGILLAVIGILHEIKDVVNLPAWIAAGGLLPSVEHTLTQEMVEKGWTYIASLDCSSAETAAQQGRTLHAAPTLLPSHPDYKHWYQSPLHTLYWVRRGLIALHERGIDPRDTDQGV